MVRLASVQIGDTRTWGIVDNNRLHDFRTADMPSLQAAIAQFGGDSQALCRHLEGRHAPDAYELDGVSWLPPVVGPSKVLCIGRNYADHALEQGAEIPSAPIIFNKFPGNLIGHQGQIRIPPMAQQVDYEGELVVVIGKPGRFISESAAMSHVFGYTIGNDVTARDWQKGRPGGQWLLGKAIDTFGPLGPSIVPACQIEDPNALEVRTRLNGEQVQAGNTSQFLFSIPFLISHLSQFFQLNSGDLLFTGTPEGVGIARTPPLLLKPGDRIEVEIASLGRLENSVLSYES